MAVFLGRKWTEASRLQVSDAIVAGLLPDDAEYSINGEWGSVSYVMLYQRRPGRGAGTGSTRFYALEGTAETLKVTQQPAFPPPVEAEPALTR